VFNRLKNYIFELRKINNFPSLYIEFEFLVNKLDKYRNKNSNKNTIDM